MSVSVDQDGNVIIKIKSMVGAIEELRERRLALLDLVATSKNDDVPEDTKYHALQLVYDTEPSIEQWKKALQ